MAYEFDKLNINWDGGGGFARNDWQFVRTVIQEHDIKTVLEYGCGLSTELMVAMGLDVLSLETQPQFFEIYQAAGFNVRLCDYDAGYPLGAEHFDLAFVDGPGEQERHDRSKSVIHAMQYCRVIYLHDYNLGQFEHLDESPSWVAVTHYTERQNHLYMKTLRGMGLRGGPKCLIEEAEHEQWRIATALLDRGVALSAEFAELVSEGP